MDKLIQQIKSGQRTVENLQKLDISSIRAEVCETKYQRSIAIDKNSIDANVDREACTIKDLSFSSAEPYERWYGYEILDHSAASIRMERWQNSPPFLADHNSSKLCGVIEDGYLDGGSGMLRAGEIRMSKNPDAQAVFNDIADKIRLHTSIGYMVHEIVPELDPLTKKQVKINEIPVYRVVDWEPLEGSSVTIPADMTVGLGRSLDDHNEQIIQTQIKNNQPEQTEPVQIKENNETQKTGDYTMTPEEILAQERARCAEIEAIGDAAKMPSEDIRKAKDTGTTVEDFRKLAFEFAIKNAPKPMDGIGMSKKETEQFSLSKLLTGKIEGKIKEHAPFEYEAIQTAEKKYAAKHGGSVIPFEVINNMAGRALQQLRANPLVSNTGANLVQTTVDSNNYIDLLANIMLALKLGVQVIPLAGPTNFPKQLTGSSVGWMAENGTAPGSSDATFGSLSFALKTMLAITGYSRELVLQSNPRIDMLIFNDLMRAVALGSDSAIFSGSGSAGQPRGIINTSGIGSATGTSGAALTLGNLVDRESDIDAGNALSNNLAYVTTPAIRGLLKQTPIVSNQPIMILGPDGKANGYDVYSTGQMAANKILFGDFSQAIFAEFGDVELYTDPVADNGIFKVKIFKSCDVGVRYPQAFSLFTKTP